MEKLGLLYKVCPSTSNTLPIFVQESWSLARNKQSVTFDSDAWPCQRQWKRDDERRRGGEGRRRWWEETMKRERQESRIEVCVSCVYHVCVCMYGVCVCVFYCVCIVCECIVCVMCVCVASPDRCCLLPTCCVWAARRTCLWRSRITQGVLCPSRSRSWTIPPSPKNCLKKVCN